MTNKCQNCGKDFEDLENKTDVCPECYEYMMEQWAKEVAAQEYANQLWRKYFEEEWRKER